MIIIGKSNYCQISPITNPFVGNSVYNQFPSNNSYITYFTSKSSLYYYHLDANNIDSISLAQVASTLNFDRINSLQILSDNSFIIEVREATTQKANKFITLDKGKFWSAFKFPINTYSIFIENNSSNLYFNRYNTSLQKYSIIRYNFLNNSWDSSGFNNNIQAIVGSYNQYLVLNVKTNSPPTYSSFAISQDNGISYHSITLDYNKIPFTDLNNGVLNNLNIVSSNFWLANYQYDSAGTTVEHLYSSKDTGVTWKICFDKTPSIIAPASNSVAYAYFVQNTTPTSYAIYQISEAGDKICKLPFSKRIYNMRFFNSNNGLILTVDTPNQQPGIWRVTNGGGAPCIIAGINDKNIQSNLIKLYPNPANNQITLTNYSLPVHSNYQIYNLLGTLVQQGNLEEKETTININTLADGLYFIRVGDTSLKFVKGKD